MMGFFTCVQKQLPESDEIIKPTYEKGETNPLDVTFDYIAEDLFLSFEGVKSLRKAKKVIEKKYEIKKERDDCWPADDIKRVWEQTQRMNLKSSRRRYWAHVIILQMLKRFMVYGFQACKTKPRMKENSEDASSESSSASSTDVAPLPAELKGKICYPHLHSNESRNAALANESEDTLDNNCEQRKSIDKHKELNFTDMPNRTEAESENGRWEDDDINQACGKTESIKGNAKERSTQSSDELKITEAAGGDKQSSGAKRISFPAGSQAIKNDPHAPNKRSRTNVSAASESGEADEIICIRIPFSEMFSSGSRVSEHVHLHLHQSSYKLINGFPSDSDLRKRKSYVMSFNNETRNAELVYEILNRETLANNCQEPGSFGYYVKGHLAAAGNHRWCREANNDVNLFSNIIPQNSALNSSKWRIVENRCRSMTEYNEIRNVHVYTGPLYLEKQNNEDVRVPDTRGMNRLGGKVVPTHLFKVIIEERMDGTVEKPKCYVFPNVAPQPYLRARKKKIGYIESVSGLRFIERRPNVNMRDYIKTVTLQGETGNEEPCRVDIQVRIC